MYVGRYDARRILQHYVCTDFAVGAVRVERDALLHQFSAIFESGDFVVKSLVSQLGVE